MKALRFARTGSLDALTLTELRLPVLAEGEALVRVHAAGVNPSDVRNVQGRFPYTTLPRTPGRDFAGVIMQGPPGWVGKEVWGTGAELGFTRDGSHAEYLALAADGCADKPAGLSFEQAASCGVPYTTAWEALKRTAVRGDTHVLVIGANGAVGKAAIDLALARGAHVLAAVRSAEQVQALTARGIETLQLTDAASLSDQVRSHAGFGDGAEVVFDTTGAWLPAGVPALAKLGRVAIIAAPADGHERVPVLQLYRRGGQIVGINSLLYDSVECAAMLSLIARAFDRNELPLPAAPQVVKLADGVALYHRFDAAKVDKTVLVPS